MKEELKKINDHAREHLNNHGLKTMSWDAFQQLSVDDQFAYSLEVAQLFFKNCVRVGKEEIYEFQCAMKADDAFEYFECYCEWIGCWHVNRFVGSEWLTDRWKEYAGKVHGKDVQLGWCVYQDFVEEGAHLLIFGMACTALEGMRHPNEQTFVTADYNPEANTIEIEIAKEGT